MKLLCLALLLIGLAACERDIPQRSGGSEGSAAQSAGGVGSDEGRAARRAGR